MIVERSPSMLFSTPSALRIAVYGAEVSTQGRGVGLWSVGYKATVTAAGATPVFLKPSTGSRTWSELLDGCKGVVVSGFENSERYEGDMESLCTWCKQRKF